ncbi:hypothetical protein WS62_12075 [Burkholderia sp. ABCPW 14]|nr:hypothetical protein WS62_12075 [Burkholderia sp. ABCPW 14]
MPTSAAGNTGAGMDEPDAPTIALVTIGPTTPPMFDTMFCKPAAIDTVLPGAASSNSRRRC